MQHLFFQAFQQIILDDLHVASERLRKKIDGAAAEKVIDGCVDEGMNHTAQIFKKKCIIQKPPYDGCDSQSPDL